MKKNNDSTCGECGSDLCGTCCAYIFCRKYDSNDQYKKWDKLFHLVDEFLVLRERISKLSDDPSANLVWHKSRVGELKKIIRRQYAIITKRVVHDSEVAVYLASTVVESEGISDE